MQANSLKHRSNNPLTPEQTELLERLAAPLSPEQAHWIAGYLTGIHASPQTPSQPTATPLTILYGSESGNSETLAEQARRRAEETGLSARVFDMADYRRRDLRDERLIMIITATHGEGDPPDPAEDFYHFLHSRKAPKLAGVKFAVLALGDSSYEHFCQTGRDFDNRLEALGAERIQERVDCDVDYEDSAHAWIEKTLSAFAGHTETAASSPDNIVSLTEAAKRAESTVYGKNNPFPAEILDSINLNGRGSDKETRHIELDIAGSGMHYEPGDVACILPENHPDIVNELIDTLGMDASASIHGRNGETTLEEALRRDHEITAVTPPFIQAWAELADSATLREKAADGNRRQLLAWAADRRIADVLREYPATNVDAARFIETLRPLLPRDYSIASSLNANPDEIHLTVAAVRYHTELGYREGVASTWLADRLEPGDTVPVYIKRNKNFKLPADQGAPVIMVGPGTGVAPFRAFLEERDYQEAGGKNWLFFGDRRFRTDFLYQIEWQRWLKDGLLTRLEVAFSRDGQEKVYVQDRMREHARELYDWLEAGAYFYVCGDAEYMAPDVHRALIEIVRDQGGLSNEQAQEYVKQLQRDKRYQRDVY
ncbi:MAG: assimilatory sulfite reductase (NADPH) flavoprotein subunit [Gammaproteobacteria bacterium]